MVGRGLEVTDGRAASKSPSIGEILVFYGELDVRA